MPEKKEKESVVLLILDGWGIAPASKGNAISLAKKPNFDYLLKKFPHTELGASGESVGLLAGMAGNSEAGHFNLGAGKIVLDDAVYISQSIENGLFFENQTILEAIKHVKKNKSKFHLIGLFSDETTGHADPNHLLALIKMAEQNGIENIYLHLITDGRDTTPHSFLKAYAKLKELLNGAKIVSLVGRFYAMDRKKEWSRIELAYNLFTLGRGRKFENVEEAISYAYGRPNKKLNLLTDEYIPPSIITQDGKTITMDDGDAAIFFNLRSDRARQLTKVFVQKQFYKKNPGSFHRQKYLRSFCFVALTDFGPDLDDVHTAYPSRLAEQSIVHALKDFSQAYLAEREKYAHITYFFNGGHDQPVAGEKRFLIPSPTVENYDLYPEMNTREVSQKIIKKLRDKKTNFIVANFPNPDILGHTGNIPATIKAIEFIDTLLGKIYKETAKQKVNLIITADHGNAEKMIDETTGEIFNGHTTNPVPFILASERYKKVKLRKGGILGDVAPTILDILGVEKPKEMTGQSLIK